MQNREVRQHEPLRVPDGWSGQDRMLVIQIERLFDQLYAKVGELEKKVEELSSEE